MINNDIRALVSDYIVLKPFFDDQELATYQNTVTELTAKICDLLPRKMEITYQTIPDYNRPLWLWHSGRKEPQIAIYQEVGTYFSVVNGFGTIEMDKSVSFESATHFMYINRLEEFTF
jgi:hypothetical protein